MTIDNSQLTDKARGIARCLTYNDDKHQAAAKHMLLELSHRLDTKNVRVHKKRDGLMVINALGRARYMTLLERLLYRLFGIVPEVRESASQGGRQP